MDEADEQYSKLISEKKFAEASDLAGSIHDMFEKNIEALGFQQDSDEYQESIKWSSYWKLRRDIYKSYINQGVTE